jgi:hypothetical protein
MAACLQPAAAQVLPLEQRNTLNDNWLVQDELSGQLVPLTKQIDVKALHQWVYIDESQPFRISFAAPKATSLFLNNKLIFSADSTHTYSADLTKLSSKIKPFKGKYLLTIWHPEQQPRVKSFQNINNNLNTGHADKEIISVKTREYLNQNVYIILLLFTGLIYGYLRVNYTADFNSLFSADSFMRISALDEGLLAKPIGSLASILFVLAFSISLSLLIVALHTNVHQIKLFNQIIQVSGADITTKVIFYTILIFFVILLKYLFIKVMSFIFGLEQVAGIQYREFVRTLLFLGVLLPFVMLFYLVFHLSEAGTILTISNIVISLLLIITTIRVSATVNTKTTILNLHLFSYLCATEVIPLAIMLKLIVYNF